MGGKQIQPLALYPLCGAAHSSFRWIVRMWQREHKGRKWMWRFVQFYRILENFLFAIRQYGASAWTLTVRFNERIVILSYYSIDCNGEILRACKVNTVVPYGSKIESSVVAYSLLSYSNCNSWCCILKPSCVAFINDFSNSSLRPAWLTNKI